MTGICGFYVSQWSESLDTLLDHQLKAMTHNPSYRWDVFSDPSQGLGLGRSSLGVFNPVDQPVTSMHGRCLTVFHGELYGRNNALSDPEYALCQYIEGGDGFARELQGVFHCAVVDFRERKIKLVSDKFGLEPLYYSQTAQGIVFAGKVKGVLEAPGLARAANYQSLADYYHFGQVLGHKTLFKNIHLLPPGSMLIFDMDKLTSTVKTYWKLDELFVENGKYEQNPCIDDVIDAFQESVRKRSESREQLGLSLSGGLDSRGILAGLGAAAHNIQTYTLGLPGCADQGLADRMARAAGTRHEFIELNQDYIQSFQDMALQMITFSDGMYHPHESTEMLALKYMQKADFSIMLRGHGGEIGKAALAYPVMVSNSTLASRSPEQVLEGIYAKTNLVLQDFPPQKLFSSSLSPWVEQGPRQSLQESCAEASQKLSPADVHLYYYINEHIRRQVVASLDIFRTEAEIRMPYIDETFLGFLLKLPLRYRMNGEMHRRLIRKCMPGLVKIPDSNTGVPLDAGKARLYLTDKFNSLLKKMKISGFRHYTEFQDWFRKGFKNDVEAILFSEQSSDRGLYNMDQLRSVFEDHVSGNKNYGHLLGTAIGLELWFRTFVD